MKILILGVGNAQIDAIEYCRKAGHEIYGCSYTNTEKGISLLDHFEQLNIVDREAILAYAKQENMDVVYSIGSDIAMPTACYVSEKLSLPHFVSYETAKTCNHKQLMRQALGPDFRGNVEFVIAGNKEGLTAYHAYPGVIKPVDSQGQRGVFRVDSREEAMARFDEAVSYSKDGLVILERYLDGPEISINAYMLNGEMVFGLVSDRVSFREYPGGLIKEHYLPSSHTADEQAKALDLARRVAKALKIENGPCYYQIKLVDGEPYLVEVTPRFDGCHMWKLIRHFTGVDLLDLCFRHLSGGTVSPEDFTIRRPARKLRTVFMCQAPGTAVKKTDYPNALESRWYYDEGETVRRMNGFMEKCGYRMEEWE